MAGTEPRFDVSKAGNANPYAGTTAAITPEAAKAAGWDPGVIIGVIQSTGQVMQDRSAQHDPEGSAEAKEVLKVVGLEDYAASDKAIQAGRERAAREEAERRAREMAARERALQDERARREREMHRSASSSTEKSGASVTTSASPYSGPTTKYSYDPEAQSSQSSNRVTPTQGSAPVSTTGNAGHGGFVTGGQTYSIHVPKPLPPKPAPVRVAQPETDVAATGPTVRRSAPTPGVDSPFGVAPPPPMPVGATEDSARRPPTRAQSESGFDLDDPTSEQDQGLGNSSGFDEYEEVMRQHEVAMREQRERERADDLRREQAERDEQAVRDYEADRARSSSCRRALAQVDAEERAASSRWIGALQAASGTVWWTNRAIETTQSQCVGVEPEYSRLADLERAAASARATCEQLTAGGGECVSTP